LGEILGGDTAIRLAGLQSRERLKKTGAGMDAYA
jgi:hypothetical protein